MAVKTAPYPPGDGLSGIPSGHNPGHRATLRRDNIYETYRRAVMGKPLTTLQLSVAP